MKINFHIDPELKTEHIDLWLHKITPEIDRLIQQIGAANQTLWCHVDAQIIPVSYQDIFCLEAADRGINVFTADQQLFYHDRLSRLKEELPNDFITASRSAIFNFAAIGVLFGPIISLAFNYVYGASSYYPSAPSFVGHFEHVLNAVSISALLWATIGELFGFGSFIFSIERWSLRKRTVINFVTYYLGLSVLAILAGWFPLNGANFAVFTLIFVAIYVTIWLYSSYRAHKEIHVINQKIKKK
ncbi:DUF3021 family protein [Limosilactobacillus kribbianus]|uniref:DUF3021 family protein n=1 Tax=Limosilactobacillus kribbianus TaxID=2982695 RepID=UPI0022643F5C|nr:DUF3021 family protein [Limosilactobacillus kribbianus]